MTAQPQVVITAAKAWGACPERHALAQCSACTITALIEIAEPHAHAINGLMKRAEAAEALVAIHLDVQTAVGPEQMDEALATAQASAWQRYLHDRLALLNRITPLDDKARLTLGARYHELTLLAREMEMPLPVPPSPTEAP